MFVVTYSVKPHGFPQQIREVAGAMELVHQRAEEWNVDTSRIAMIGFSAGGHLAGSLGVLWNNEFIEKDLGVNKENIIYIDLDKISSFNEYDEKANLFRICKIF